MKPFIAFLVFSFVVLSASAQETIRIVDAPKKSFTKEIYYVLKSDKSIKHGIYQKHGYKGRIETQGYYRHGLKDSLWIDYNYSGKSSEGYYKADKKDGLWKYYYNDGKTLKSHGSFKENIKVGIWEFYNDKSELIQKYNFDTKELLYYEKTDNQSNIETEIHTDEGIIKVKLDRPVMYIGGKEEMMPDLYKSIRYTETALDNGTQGTVIITFFVGKNGVAYDFEIKEGVKDGLSEEALRVVKLMKDNWIPAIYNDSPVVVKMQVPIKFRMVK